MARKIVRRPNLPEETLQRARRELERSGDIAPMPTPSVRRVTAVPAAQPVVTHKAISLSSDELRAHYQYVLNDLRNMAILASGIMIVLVALSFVL